MVVVTASTERKRGIRNDLCAFCGAAIGDAAVFSFHMKKLPYKPRITWHLECADEDDLERRAYAAFRGLSPGSSRFDALMVVGQIEKRSPDRVRYFGKKKTT